MKLSGASDTEVINCREVQFSFELPSVVLARRTNNFLVRNRISDSSITNSAKCNWPAVFAAYSSSVLFITSPGRSARYCDQRVCLFVCLFVCPLAYLNNHTSKFYQIFRTCYMWPWLVPPLRMLQICFQPDGEGSQFILSLLKMPYISFKNPPKSRWIKHVCPFS